MTKLTENKELYAKYETDKVITWCSGCGNFSIQNALKRALTLENIQQDEVVICFDVGCSGNGADKIEGYTIHGLHGRAISLGAGIQLANPKLKVVATAGDGATFSEGINHLIHAIRSNYNVLFLHHNNSNYALTTGQPSSTTKPGQAMNSAPDGTYLDPLNPLDIVMSLNPSFAARTFSGDIKHMTKMIQAGLSHKGFAFIEIIQTCPTYDRRGTKKSYWDKVKYTDDLPDYDPSDLKKAKALAAEVEKEIVLGILYQDPNRKDFLARLPNREGTTSSPVDEVKQHSISTLLKEFE